MNKIILWFAPIVICATISTSAFAINTKESGAYIEGNVGYGKINEKINVKEQNFWGSFTTHENISTKNSGLVGNVNVGYKFNQNLGLELGATLFPNIKFKGKDSSIPKQLAKQNGYVHLAAKAITPIGSGVSIFAKAGVAMAHTQQLENFNKSSRFYKKQFKPVALVGAGVSYACTENLSLVAQGTATTRNGNNVPPMFAATIGLNYTF